MDLINENKLYFLKVVSGLMFAQIIFVTVFGNGLVILAIVKDKRYHTPSNYLIVSLAVTDLIVGLITVPLRAIVELMDYGEWRYGALLCDLRVVIDRLSVYASIYHVLAIALDRHLSVTSVNYSLVKKRKHIFLMITISWILALGFALAAFLGWRDGKYLDRIANKVCIVSKDFSLNITIWLCVYIVPVLLTLLIYVHIYQIARKKIRKSKVKRSESMPNSCLNISDGITTTTTTSMIIQSPNSDSLSVAVITSKHGDGLKDADNVLERKLLSLEKREKRIAKTLTLITLSVIICWFPFFTFYALSSIFGVRFVGSNIVFQASIWLGYLNSLLNPIIYAINNPYYRRSFFKLLHISPSMETSIASSVGK